MFREVSAASLAYLRIVLGFMLIYIFNSSFHQYFVNNLLHSEYLVHYDFFQWVNPLPIFYFDWMFYLMYVSSFFLAIGYKYRLNAVICFLGFSYCFFLDKGHYNNHYYLYTILLFFFCIVDANKYMSIDALLDKNMKKTVPYWQIFIFKIQIFIVYFFGGIAKLHYDWILGFPMRFWLYDNSFAFPNFIGDFLSSRLGALFFSYGGILFDLAIGFLLFSKKWKRLALIPLLFFHVNNHFLWSIGTFPWVMILTTTIFFNTNWFNNFIEKIKNRKFLIITDFFNNLSPSKIINFFWPKHSSIDTKIEELNYSLPKWKKQIASTFLVLWITFQFLFPLRRYIINGHPSWTGQGQLFAWRMMLVDTTCAVKMKLINPSENKTDYIGFEYYMNWDQFRKMSRTPISYLNFAHFIRDEAIKGGVTDPIVKMEIWKSVNKREPMLMNDTTLNYSLIENKILSYPSWITTPWKETDTKPTFTLEKYENWKRLSEKNSWDD